MGETDNASIASPQIEEKTWKEAVETGNTEDAGSTDNEKKCVRKENNDKDIRERTKGVKTIQAAQKMTSICIQPKEHCRLKKFSPYQQPHNRTHELLHYMPSSRPSIRHETRWPPCTPTDAITNAYASTHNRLNPFAMAGVGRSNSTNCVGASFNPTCIPVSVKSDPGYIGTLPALIQHCQSFDSSTGLIGRESGSNCTGFDREGRAPKDDMTTCDGEESLIPIPELIRVPDLGATESFYIDSGPVSHCVPKGQIYESITNNPMTDESNNKSRVSSSFCPVTAEVGTAFSESGKKDLKLNIEAIRQDGVMDASITPTRSSSASVGNMSPDRPFPNLFISIPKDDYIAPMHIPETCPLRRVVSTCSLYDCFDEMGRQIGCDRDGNPIMDTEGNLRSLSSISFPRHTPQGYTPRHSPGGTAVRNSSPPNSPKDFVCRAFSPSLVSAVIHSTPRPEVPRGFVNYSGAAQSSSKEGSGKSISHSPPIQYSNFNHYDSNCNSNYNSTYCSNLTGSNSNYNSNDNLHGNFGSLYDSSCNSHHNSIHSNSNNGNDSFASPEYVGFSLYRNSDDFDDNYVGLPSILSGSRCSSVTDGIFLGSDCYMTPPQSPHGNGDIYNEGDYSIVGLRHIDSIAEIPGMDTAESYSRGDSQGY